MHLIKVNLTYEDDKWQDLPYKITLSNTAPKGMYFTHLQDINTTIEKHSYYDNLDHHPKGKNDKN